MKKEKLMDAIGEIDEKLIDSADGARSGKKTKKIRWRKILIAAACVALAAAMVVTLALNFGGGSKRGVDVKDNPGTEAPLDGEFSIKTREGSRTGELVKEGEYGGFFAVEEEGSDEMAAVRGDGDYVKGTAAPGGVEGDPPFPSIADPIGEGEGEGEGEFAAALRTAKQ